ncbi:MAG: hypothetical protein Q4D11_00955 [Rhodospirillales bacterium]|nr:hypothetical protein [Rhodospirillales bacterium]
MKKTFVLFVLALLISNRAPAQESTSLGYIDEMDALGTVSGIAMACGAPKYSTFEMLARAILITKAASDDMQEQGMIAFNKAKARAFVSRQRRHLDDCNEINARFDQQKIFKTTLYRDGTIKMYDGKVFHPRQPYDANLLVDNENVNRAEVMEIYNKLKDKHKTNIPPEAKRIPPVQTAQDNHATTVQSKAVQSSSVAPGEVGGIKRIRNSNH